MDKRKFGEDDESSNKRQRREDVGGTPTPPSSTGGVGGLSPTARGGSKNWDTCQLANVMLEREGRRRDPSYLNPVVWKVIGGYFADPFVVDRIPADDMDRVREKSGIIPEIFDALLDVPGVYLAGGSTLPSLERDQYGDLDFFIHGPDDFYVRVMRAVFAFSDHILNQSSRDMAYVFSSVNAKLGMYVETPEITSKLAALRETAAGYTYDVDYESYNCFTFKRRGSKPIQFIHFNSDEIKRTPECIKTFAFDYHRCAFTRNAAGAYFRYRTREAVLAHKTKVIKYFRNDLYSPQRLGRLLLSAKTKGYALPREITHTAQAGFRIPEYYFTDTNDVVHTRITTLMAELAEKDNPYWFAGDNERVLNTICLGPLDDCMFPVRIQPRVILPFDSDFSALANRLYEKVSVCFSNRYNELRGPNVWISPLELQNDEVLKLCNQVKVCLGNAVYSGRTFVPLLDGYCEGYKEPNWDAITDTKELCRWIISILRNRYT